MAIEGAVCLILAGKGEGENALKYFETNRQDLKSIVQLPRDEAGVKQPVRIEAHWKDGQTSYCEPLEYLVMKILRISGSLN